MSEHQDLRNAEREALLALKAGDAVYKIGSYLGTWASKQTVARVTKAHIVLDDDTRYWRKGDDWRVGREVTSRMRTSRIRPMLPHVLADMAEIEAESCRKELARNLRDHAWFDEPMATLEAVQALLVKEPRQ